MGNEHKQHEAPEREQPRQPHEEETPDLEAPGRRYELSERIRTSAQTVTIRAGQAHCASGLHQ
jgi:hypothetical protein